MAVVPIQRKPLSWLERTYLPHLVVSLRITIKHFFAPSDTLQYPEQRPAIPAGYRGVPTLVRDPHGREKCVSCQLCEFVCPPKAIRITPGEIPASAETAHVEKAPKAFDIDMLRCIYCGLCEEVCPEEAIFLQTQYSMSGYTRAEMVNHKDRLYELGGTRPDSHYQVGQEEGRRGGRPRPLTSMGTSLFSFFACLTVFCAVGVVVCKNTVNAAMCLLVSLVGLAALFVQLDAYLLAFVLLLVYAGAVVTLFLFIVMLLDVKGTDRRAPRGASALAPRIAAVGARARRRSSRSPSRAGSSRRRRPRFPRWARRSSFTPTCFSPAICCRSR